MDRREFIKRTLAMAGIGTVGQFVTSPVAIGKEGGLDAHGRPAGLEPIRGYVPDFAPVREGPADQEHYVLKYDILHWRGGRQDVPRNGVVGSLRIERDGRGNNVHYNVHQNVGFGGVQNVLEGGIVCASDANETLNRWDLHTFTHDRTGNKMPLSDLQEKGSNRSGHVHVDGPNFSYEYQTERALVSQWTILHRFVSGLNEDGRQEFDVLHDLSMLKPRQQLSLVGPIKAIVKDGREMEFDTYLQTGEGTLPTHYVVDEEGRPHFVTVAMLSWALSDIA